jgi:tRNA (adenine57-N1/adenine58-N1)-methyltransferase
MADFAVLMENEGKVHIVEVKNESAKHKGIGVCNLHEILHNVDIGEEVLIGQKYFTKMPPNLPELVSGMARRAQTISAKDAGFLISKLGIGVGSTVLEAGLGSGGLSLHLAKVLGESGHLVTVEPRSEHAEIGLENLHRAKLCFQEFPEHTHLEGLAEEVDLQFTFDAIIFDMPNHSPAIEKCSSKLNYGGRLACYAPTTTQLEACWNACEGSGLEIEWCGEIIAREWGKTSKGGMRPVNGPFGHTAFLLIAQRK